MLIALICVSVFLATSIAAIIIIGIEDWWEPSEWFGMFLFVFALPVWAVIMLITYIKKRTRSKMR